MAPNATALAAVRAQFRLRSCKDYLASVRYITSIPSTQTQIPPESPKYIDIPQPLQPYAKKKPIIKGVLPVPRQIFPRGSKDKTTPEYLASVIPEPTTSNAPVSKITSPSELSEWKARLAATRRRNLREGLLELQHRKQRIDQQVSERSAYKRAEHERLVHQPEREDERLTNSSIPQEMLPGNVGRLRDPDREARLARKRSNFEAKEAERQEERRNALHSLYMNARDFIVTEADLNKKVEEVFDDKDFMDGRSIWDKYDNHAPETVQDLLNEANKTGNKAVSFNQGYARLTRQRVQKIAEELTGGKM